MGGEGGRCVRLTSPPSCAECHKMWEPKPPGTLWATPGLLPDCFIFTFRHVTDLQVSIKKNCNLSNWTQIRDPNLALKVHYRPQTACVVVEWEIMRHLIIMLTLLLPPYFSVVWLWAHYVQTDRHRLEDQCVEETVISKRILKGTGMAWTGLTWMRIGRMGRVMNFRFSKNGNTCGACQGRKLDRIKKCITRCCYMEKCLRHRQVYTVM